MKVELKARVTNRDDHLTILEIGEKHTRKKIPDRRCTLADGSFRYMWVNGTDDLLSELESYCKEAGFWYQLRHWS